MVIDETGITKDQRAKGVYFHRSPSGLHVTKAKMVACKDISAECEPPNSAIESDNNFWFTKNWIWQESRTLQLIKFIREYQAGYYWQ